MLKVATCTVVRSYIQIFSAWWVATILHNYGATLCELRYYINARPPANLSPANLSPTRLKYYRVQREGTERCTFCRTVFWPLHYSWSSSAERKTIDDAFLTPFAHELRVLLISHVFHQDYFQTLTRLTEKTNDSSWCTGQPTQTIKSELKLLSSTLQFAFSVIFFLLKRRDISFFSAFFVMFSFFLGFDTSPGRNYKWLSIRYRNIPCKESSIRTGLQLSFHERQTVRER